MIHLCHLKRSLWKKIQRPLLNDRYCPLSHGKFEMIQTSAAHLGTPKISSSALSFDQCWLWAGKKFPSAHGNTAIIFIRTQKNIVVHSINNNIKTNLHNVLKFASIPEVSMEMRIGACWSLIPKNLGSNMQPRGRTQYRWLPHVKKDYRRKTFFGLKAEFHSSSNDCCACLKNGFVQEKSNTCSYWIIHSPQSLYPDKPDLYAYLLSRDLDFVKDMIAK